MNLKQRRRRKRKRKGERKKKGKKERRRRRQVKEQLDDKQVSALNDNLFYSHGVNQCSQERNMMCLHLDHHNHQR